MPDYRNLRVFIASESLSSDVHTFASTLPGRSVPGLASQLCRSIASVPTNIAEGANQSTQSAFVRYLIIARGSADESSVHLRRAQLAGARYVQIALDLEDRAHMIAAMLTKLIARIQENEARAENERRLIRPHGREPKSDSRDSGNPRSDTRYP